MRPTFVRSPYNYDVEAVSDETGLRCEEPTLAQQQFKEECDINTIVERFGLTGQLPENPSVPRYGDFTGISDFQSAMNAVRKAEADFMELPAAVRARFNHDPQQLLEFVEDGRNLEEARSLGLVPAASVQPDPPVTPPAS